MKNLKTTIMLTLVVMTTVITIFSCNQTENIVEQEEGPITSQGNSNENTFSEAMVETEAIEIGHAIGDVVIELNNLTQSDYCSLLSIVNDNTLSDEAKYEAMGGIPGLSNYVNSINHAAATFENNDFPTVWDDPSQKGYVVNGILEKMGFDPDWVNDRPNHDPCRDYKLAVDNCVTGMATCTAAGALGCLFAGPAYPACVAGVTTICAIGGVACGNNADAAYPECVPGGRLVPQPWIGDPEACQDGGGSGTHTGM